MELFVLMCVQSVVRRDERDVKLAACPRQGRVVWGDGRQAGDGAAQIQAATWMLAAGDTTCGVHLLTWAQVHAKALRAHKFNLARDTHDSLLFPAPLSPPGGAGELPAPPRPRPDLKCFEK